MMDKAYLEVDEVEQLEAATTNLRDRLLVRLMFCTGCRVSEVVGLGVHDLDPEAGTVRAVKQKERLRLCCPDCSTHLGRNHQFCPGCGRQLTRAERRLQEVSPDAHSPFGP